MPIDPRRRRTIRTIRYERYLKEGIGIPIKPDPIKSDAREEDRDSIKDCTETTKTP